MIRRLRLLAALLLALTVLAPRPADAVQPIEINPEVERLDITTLGDAYRGSGSTLQIEMAQGPGATGGRISVTAQTPGTSPNWFVFALRNPTDKQIERWFAVDRYSWIGSGVVWPDLDARRVEQITPSIGFVPERIKSDRADIFRITVEPGQTVTYVAELTTANIPRFTLWRPIEYEQKARDRQLFNGIMLGITGLLALFLTVVFAANHKIIFPAAALFTWCVLAYLCVDFGFWHKLFSVRPEENAQYRAAGEAAMAATLLMFTHAFLRIGLWNSFARMLFALWVVAQISLVAVAFLDPKLAATFARVSAAAVGVVGGLLMIYLALRGQDRAISLIPTWILMLVWMLAAALTFAGRLSGDLVTFGIVAGLVLIVMLIGFTVTQYAFRSAEPLYGAQPDDMQLRSLALEGSGASVWQWSSHRDEVKTGTLLEAALGLPPGELSTKFKDFASRMHPADRERLHLQLTGLADRREGEVRCDFRMRHVDNAWRWFELEASSIPSASRRAVRCVGIVREVTDQRRARERLMHDAVHDNLTGLPNRALFIDRLEVAGRRSQAEPLVRPSVMFIDIDKFRSVNSSFGLTVGDSLLLAIARRLARHLGPNDTLARIGGDQFALLYLNEHDPRELAILADNVRRSLRSPFNFTGKEIVVTGSIGITVSHGAVAEPLSLLREAEIAMYRAKRSGPDHIEIFKPELRDEKDERVRIETDLRRALERNQLRLQFQPIMALSTERLVGFEALVRWEHPELGLLNPADFVPVAEESDLIVTLGTQVLGLAVREAQRWQAEISRADAPLFVSVNVSRRQLLRQELVDEVRQILGRALLAKGSLRLEVTESLVMENPEQAGHMLDQLAAAGAGLALDDFGTGYSSLAYLSRFPFDTIKVDRGLVHASGREGSSAHIMRSIVALATELDKRVVAEGVETSEDAAFLRSIGCAYAQGYYYGEPMSEREVMALLKRIRKAELRFERGGLIRKRAREPVKPAAEAASIPSATQKKRPAAPQQRQRAENAQPTRVAALQSNARLRVQAGQARAPAQTQAVSHGAMNNKTMPPPPQPRTAGPPPVPQGASVQMRAPMAPTSPATAPPPTNVTPLRPPPPTAPMPTGPAPNLAQLPPVIAESLAKLAAGQGARLMPPVEPVGVPPEAPKKG